jgi:hypothetical protein
MADEKGGFPYGYFSVAVNVGIIKQSKQANDEPLNKRVFAELIFNALNSKIMEQTNWGLDPNYTTDNKNLLNARYNLYKIKGVVTGNQKTTLLNQNGLSNGRVSVNNIEYTCNKDTIHSMIGRNIIAYVEKIENDIGKIVYALDDKNNVVAINSDDIVKNKVTLTNITYTNDDKNIDKKISPEAIVILNEISYFGYTKDTFLTDNTKITLIDNNSDSIYDVVMIDKGDSILARTVDIINGKIFYIDNELVKKEIDNISFDELESKGCIVNELNEKISKNDLRANDVFTIYYDFNHVIKKIVVSGIKVKGTISQAYFEKNYWYYQIDNTTYRDIANLGLNVSDSSILYLDFQNQIVASEKLSLSDVSDKMIYGYIYNAKLKSALDKRLILKIYTQYGEHKVIQVRDKITLNFQQSKTSTDVLTALSYNGTEITPTIAFLDIDDSGFIRGIFLPETRADHKENSVFSLLGTGQNDLYYRSNGAFGARFMLTTKTVVFVIPNDKSKEMLFSISSRKMFADSSKYKFFAYGDSKYNLIDAMVVPITGGELDFNAKFFMVDKLTDIADSDGNQTGKLYGLCDNKYTSYTISNEIYNDSIKNLKQGDLIRISLDPLNEISGFKELIYKGSDTMPIEMVSESVSEYSVVGTGFHLVYGYDYSKKDGITLIKYTINSVEKEIIVDTNVILPYVYDRTQKKVFIGNASHIRDKMFVQNPSKAFVKTNSVKVDFLAIFND